MEAPVCVPIGPRVLVELDAAGRRHLVATWRELDERAQSGRAFAVFVGLLVAAGAWAAGNALADVHLLYGALPLGVTTTAVLRALGSLRKVRAFRRAARELGLEDRDAEIASRRLGRLDLLSFPDDDRLVHQLTS